MKIRELRATLKRVDRAELVEIFVEVYKALPKALIEEECIDDIIENHDEWAEARQREKAAAKRLREANNAEGNVASIAALRKWKSIPEYDRELLLKNVWCSHCADSRGLTQYTVQPAGPDIVLRGTCPVCHHEVARYVEID